MRLITWIADPLEKVTENIVGNVIQKDAFRESIPGSQILFRRRTWTSMGVSSTHRVREHQLQEASTKFPLSLFLVRLWSLGLWIVLSRVRIISSAFTVDGLVIMFDWNWIFFWFFLNLICLLFISNGFLFLFFFLEGFCSLQKFCVNCIVLVLWSLELWWSVVHYEDEWEHFLFSEWTMSWLQLGVQDL